MKLKKDEKLEQFKNHLSYPECFENLFKDPFKVDNFFEDDKIV
ncbi:hypothetical protein AAFF_G00401940 [Aldrovandia affinis]|uniref:Uncharacterized protein n=1 Tax=Aldrovandia affinis TaxID=143900 RepID=A0AAD7VYR3_9TELE|nr:hypothetical protein AAFF_G00401940 [Aldrovandia affinis]